MINRSQGLVLGFFAAVVVALVVILALAPSVYGNILPLSTKSGMAIDIAFPAALIAFIALLSVAVIRRWTWIFWLLLIAFLAGVLRLPASVMELLGLLPRSGPTWYVLLQGVIGIVQFGIGLALVIGYRKGGVWGSF